MQTNLEIKTGQWLLVAGSRAILPTLLRTTGRLAETGPVRLVDCGCMFDPFIAGHGLRGGLEALERIEVSEAFNCHAMLEVLESLESGPAPFVVLDLLRTFCYPEVDFRERKRLLGLCLGQLDRLAGATGRGEAAAAGDPPGRLIGGKLPGPGGGLVSLHLPARLCAAESELLEMVTRAAGDMIHVEMAAAVQATGRGAGGPGRYAGGPK